jgi:hypothetical protein
MSPSPEPFTSLFTTHTAAVSFVDTSKRTYLLHGCSPAGLFGRDDASIRSRRGEHRRPSVTLDWAARPAPAKVVEKETLQRVTG